MFPHVDANGGKLCIQRSTGYPAPHGASLSNVFANLCARRGSRCVRETACDWTSRCNAHGENDASHL